MTAGNEQEPFISFDRSQAKELFQLSSPLTWRDLLNLGERTLVAREENRSHDAVGMYSVRWMMLDSPVVLSIVWLARDFSRRGQRRGGRVISKRRTTAFSRIRLGV